MKLKLTFLALLFIGFGQQAEAQLLKKLKQKAEKAAERVLIRKTEEKTKKVTEAAFDSVANRPMKNQKQGNSSSNTHPEGSSEVAQASMYVKPENYDTMRQFYHSDLIVTTDEGGTAGTAMQFDVDVMAMKLQGPDGKTGYIDSEGFNYAFNNSEQKWQKTGLMKSDAMAFMMPMMSSSILKMPVGPSMEAAKQMKSKGLNANTFQLAEWAFIYKPEHFRNLDYTESKVKCASGNCTKFSFNDPDVKGSYALFDNENRLTKVHANIATPEGNKSGDYNFEYTDVRVNVPAAEEVKMPFQDLWMKGLDSNIGGNRGDDNSTGSEGSSNEATHSMLRAFKESGKNSASYDDLPDSYTFDWQYKTKMVFESKKKEERDLVLLLKKGASYQGIKVEDAKTGNLGEVVMVFDILSNTMVMFVESKQGQNVVQMYPIPKEKINTSDIKQDFTIKTLPNKTVMGYECTGLEMENDKYVVQFYHAAGTPITLGNFISLGGTERLNLPEIDPRLMKQFSDGLIMEMHYTDKKKSKNNMSIIGQSLEKVSTVIRKNDYKDMDFMGQLRNMQN